MCEGWSRWGGLKPPHLVIGDRDEDVVPAKDIVPRDDRRIATVQARHDRVLRLGDRCDLARLHARDDAVGLGRLDTDEQSCWS